MSVSNQPNSELVLAFQQNLKSGLVPISSEQEAVLGVVKASDYFVDQLSAVLDSPESVESKRLKIAMICTAFSRQISELSLQEGVEKVVQFMHCFENNYQAGEVLDKLSLSDFFDLKNPAIFIAFLIKDTKKATISDSSRLGFYKVVLGEYGNGDLSVFNTETGFFDFFQELDWMTGKDKLGQVLAKDMLNYYISTFFSTIDFSLSYEDGESLMNGLPLSMETQDDLIDQLCIDELSEKLIRTIETLYPKIFKELKDFIIYKLKEDLFDIKKTKNWEPKFSRSTTELESLINRYFKKPNDLRNEVSKAVSLASNNSTKAEVPNRVSLPKEVMEAGASESESLRVETLKEGVSESKNLDAFDDYSAEGFDYSDYFSGEGEDF